MAEPSAFRFYEDPVAKTTPTEVFIAVAGTWSMPLVNNAPAEVAPKVAQAIRDLAGQEIGADGVAETSKTIYKADGAVFGVVSCTVTPGAPPTVATITVLGNPYSVQKALDLADGLEQFIS